MRILILMQRTSRSRPGSPSFESYRDARDHAQDEFDGELGDRPFERSTREPASLPETYSFSIDIGARWEEALFAETLPHTRRVGLRIPSASHTQRSS
jgi:hypothetical protein